MLINASIYMYMHVLTQLLYCSKYMYIVHVQVYVFYIVRQRR